MKLISAENENEEVHSSSRVAENGYDDYSGAETASLYIKSVGVPLKPSEILKPIKNINHSAGFHLQLL